MQTMKFFKEVGNIPLLLMATLIPPSLSAEEGRHVLDSLRRKAMPLSIPSDSLGTNMWPG